MPDSLIPHKITAIPSQSEVLQLRLVCVIGPAATLLVADVEELIGAVGLTVVVITVVTIVVVIYEVVMYVVGALLIMIVFPSPKILLICDAD